MNIWADSLFYAPVTLESSIRRVTVLRLVTGVYVSGFAAVVWKSEIGFELMTRTLYGHDQLAQTPFSGSAKLSL